MESYVLEKKPPSVGKTIVWIIDSGRMSVVERSSDSAIRITERVSGSRMQIRHRLMKAGTIRRGLILVQEIGLRLVCTILRGLILIQEIGLEMMIQKASKMTGTLVGKMIVGHGGSFTNKTMRNVAGACPSNC